MGSGRTWPHDFRFLVCFFSELVASAAGVAVAVASAEAESAAMPDRRSSSAWSRSSFNDEGLIISEGSMVALPKSDGYMSPGVDRKDSAGEFSNLSSGEPWVAFQESILVLDLFWRAGKRRSCDYVVATSRDVRAEEQRASE